MASVRRTAVLDMTPDERQRLSDFAWDAGVALTEGGTLATMLDHVAESMVEHLGAALARIWSLNPQQDGPELCGSAGRLAFGNGSDGPDAAMRFKLADVVRSRRAVVTNAVINDSRIDQGWAAEHGIVSCAAFPLVVAGNVVGVIVMYGREPISDAIVHAISSTAHGVASAMEGKRLEAFQARLAAIIEATRDLVATSTADYTSVRYMNRAGRTLLGIGPDEAIPDISKFRHASFAAEARDVILPKALKDGHWSGETAYVSRDGRVIPVFEQFIAHAFADGKARVSTIATDITERKRIDAQLRQSQKMEAIGQLAGGVAHDFNNLLTVILGRAEFVVADPACAEHHQSDVREIIKAAGSAAALTRQLLAFSRKQVLQARLVDVNGLVTGMMDMLGRLIGEHIKLATVLAADLGPVCADPGQLEQVLMNLTVNARDAMPDGGRLLIETAEVHLDHRSGFEQVVVPGRYAMLSVTDTGAGMDAQTRSRLFEPFFTTKDLGQGTGLGLATVYGIVKQSGGHIQVGSELGHGAMFKVYLPVSTGDTPPPVVATAVESLQPGIETVLLVEDQDGVRHLTNRMLQTAGYRVLDAANPAEAKLLFAQHAGSVDLVLTDVVMPGSSGPNLVLSLVAQKPGLKVLYMSGYNEDAIVRQNRLERGLPFLQKPFTAVELTRSVREVLSQSQ